MKPPAPNELEVTIFGPGFGESVVIHVGSNRWLVVDSCIDSACGRPAALGYFDKIGVDASSAVKFILVTHWHDDHIGGMFELIQACPNARIVCAVALCKAEFRDLVTLFNRRPTSKTSGVSEIYKVFKLLLDRQVAASLGNR